jgi:hypothetical protein
MRIKRMHAAIAVTVAGVAVGAAVATTVSGSAGVAPASAQPRNGTDPASIQSRLEADAAASAASWRIVKQLPGGEGGYAVTAAGPGSEWAFGGNGKGKPTAWLNSGSGWSQVPFPGTPGEQVTAAAASSPTNVWVFTDHIGDAGGGVGAMRWNGSAWSQVGIWYIGQIDSASVLSPTDVWAFGAPMAWHWNGKGWWMVSSAGGGSKLLVLGGSGRSADDAWVYGGLGGAAGAPGAEVAHWNGRSWKDSSVASLLDQGVVNTVYEQSPDSVYALGSTAVGASSSNPSGAALLLLHWNGSAWSRVLQKPGLSGAGGQLSGDGHGGLWLANIVTSKGRALAHYSGGKLTIAGMPNTGIQVYDAAPVPGTEGALAIGYTGDGNANVLLQYGG